MHKIITLYKFHKIQDPLKLQAALKKELKNLDILGTIIVSNEGINGTVSGTSINLDRAIECLKLHSKIYSSISSFFSFHWKSHHKVSMY